MNTVLRVSTLVLAATALSGCQSISNFFSFKQSRAEQPAEMASLFGAEELEKGRAALKAGHPARAIKLFRLAATDETSAADAFNGMAVAYSRLGRADLAERYFKTAMTLDSSNPRFAANLARFYESPLGQSSRALAMREAETAKMLASAEKAAVSEDLASAPIPAKRLGAVTIETAKPLSVTRKDRRELKIATSTSVAKAGENLAVVSSRSSSAKPSVDDAVEQATQTAVSRKRSPTVITLLGMGSEKVSRPARISIAKPGSLGATRPRARSYPIRVRLSQNPNR